MSATNGGKPAPRKPKFISKERDFNVKATVVIPAFGMPEKETDKVLQSLSRLIYLHFGEHAQVMVNGKHLVLDKGDL